jgi:hypothetical protein
MSWGVHFKSYIFIRGKSFGSMGELDDAIEEMDESIKSCNDRLLILVSSDPKNLIDKDECVMGFILNEVSDLISEISENSQNKLLLTIFRNFLIETGEDIAKFNS